MRIPTILTVSGASLALIILSACSGGGSTPAKVAASVADNPSDSVLVSVRQSTGAKTAQMDVTVNVSGIPAIGTQAITGNGSVDFGAQKAAAHFDLLGLTVDGYVDTTAAYAKSGLLGDKNTWYRTDGTNPNSKETPKAGGFANIWTNAIDPSQLFALLKDARTREI